METVCCFLLLWAMLGIGAVGMNKVLLCPQGALSQAGPAVATQQDSGREGEELGIIGARGRHLTEPGRFRQASCKKRSHPS